MKKIDKEEILKKAIEKALTNGWTPWWKDYIKRKKNGIKAKLEFKNTLEGLIIQITDKGDSNWDGYCKGGLLDWSNGYVVTVLKTESILFNLDFAKAFWGEEPMSIGDYEGVTYQNGGGNFKEIFKPSWQYHLQMMVVSDDPILYLSQFI